MWRFAGVDLMAYYRGFEILSRAYQLADSGSWTVELEIRRNGRTRSFSVNERYATEKEADVECVVLGRQIIDGWVPGWSVKNLRDPSAARLALERILVAFSPRIPVARKGRP